MGTDCKIDVQFNSERNEVLGDFILKLSGPTRRSSTALETHGSDCMTNNAFEEAQAKSRSAWTCMETSLDEWLKVLTIFMVWLCGNMLCLKGLKGRQRRIWWPRIIERRRHRYRNARLKPWTSRSSRKRRAICAGLLLIVIFAYARTTAWRLSSERGAQRGEQWSNQGPNQQGARVRLDPRLLHDPYRATRVGEASRPGPQFCSAEELAKHAQAVKTYNLKEQKSRCRTNASGAHGNACNRKESYELSTATVNRTCWRSAKKYIRKRAKAEVIFLQEHKLCSAAEIAKASAWCLRNGWKSVWSLAEPSACDGEASGGTAVLAREHLGPTYAKDYLESSPRRCAAKSLCT